MLVIAILLSSIFAFREPRYHSHILNTDDSYRGLSYDSNKGISRPFIIRRIHYNIPELEYSTNGYGGDPFPYRKLSRLEIPRVTHYQTPFRDGPSTGTMGAVSEATRGDLDKNVHGGGISILSAIIFLLLLGLSGAIGFYLGKIHESKNYVRVPAIN